MTAIGTVIDGKYEILKLIGQGGMSKVYLAMDKRLNKQWAVKEIEKNARDKNNEVIIQSAIAEASMIKRLDHAALPRIVDIIDNGIVIYVIMDYIEGESLNKVLDEFGAQPQDVVIEWAKQLCDVLNYLHNCKPPIIYRDMKPANIMLKPDGNLKLIDFGIAREYKELNLADTVPLGTKEYAAPEQFGGMGQTDARTDIYCLGVTLHHLVTGQNPSEPPYELYPIRHWNPQLSGGFEKIIQKCTQRNPDDRYQSCEELLYALEHYEENDDMFRATQKKKLKRFIWVLSASMICLAVGFIGLMINTGNYESMVGKFNSEHELLGGTAKTAEDYKEAIELKPSDKELKGYYGLIEVYKNGGFTSNESTDFDNLMKKHEKDIIESVNYPDFAFQVGLLYFNDYRGVDDNTTQGKIKEQQREKAFGWFEKAVNRGVEEFEAQKYLDVCKLYDINNSTIEVEDTSKIESSLGNNQYGKYKLNYESLKELYKGIDTEYSDDLKLEIYALIAAMIRNNEPDYKNGGITKEDMDIFVGDIKDDVEMIITKKGSELEQKKNDILNNLNSI